MAPSDPEAPAAGPATPRPTGPATPTFVLIGGMKCGTTALSAYLDAHPDVFVSPVREPHYFDRNLHEGLDWYLAHFTGARGQSQVGEATAQYMYMPQAAEPMWRALPGAKLVAILRNPVDRAYSHYWHSRARGHEDLGFEEALEAEPERIESGLLGRRRHAYVDQGLYVEQLRRMAGYYPRSQLHVGLMDDMVRDPAAFYEAVCRFLGVDTAFRPPNLGRVFNRYGHYRSVTVHRLGKRLGPRATSVVRRLNGRSGEYPPMAAATRRALVDRFRSPNGELAEWLGRDLSGWDR